MEAKKEDKGTGTPDRVPALPRPAGPSLLGRAAAVPWSLLRGMVRMNHETKAGLVVSASFLCLVGFVLYAKMQEQQTAAPPTEYQEYVTTDGNGELQAQLPEDPTPTVAAAPVKTGAQLVPTTVPPLKNVPPPVIQVSGQVPAAYSNASGNHSNGSNTAVKNGTYPSATPDTVSTDQTELELPNGPFSGPRTNGQGSSTGIHAPAKPTTPAPTHPISTPPSLGADHKGNFTDHNVPGKTGAAGATNTTLPPARTKVDTAANSALGHDFNAGTHPDADKVKPLLVADDHVKPVEKNPTGGHDRVPEKIGVTSIPAAAGLNAAHAPSTGIGVAQTKPSPDTGLGTAHPTSTAITMPSPEKLNINGSGTGAKPIASPVVSLPNAEKPKPPAPSTGPNELSGAAVGASVQLSTPRPASTADPGTKPPVHLAPPVQVAQANPPTFGSERSGLTITRPVAVSPSPAPPARMITQVGSWDEDIYHCTPADSFDQISQHYYSSARYSQALLMFNRDRQPSADGLQQNPPVLTSGGLIYVPPARVLEEKYPNAIQGYQRPPITTGSSLYHPVSAGGSALQYRVGPGGDTFFQIAQRTLGNGDTRWGDIYRLNPKYDPQQHIPAGTVLNLPPDAHIDSANAAR